MTKRKYAFWADENQLRGLKALRDRDGIAQAESIRRAIDAWLTAKGVTTARTATKKR